jgi:phage tail sheath gpL-like
MANELFATAKKKLLDGDIDLLADDIKVVCVDEDDDVPDPAADEFLADIDAGARVATSGNLTTPDTTGGVFNADPITIAAVAGDEFESIVIYKDTGNPATSALIAYIDTAAGLPCTPDGSDITITWDAGANKIFAL